MVTIPERLIGPLLHDAARPGSMEWLDRAVAEAAADPKRIPVLLPQLPRRVGREWLAANRIDEGPVQLDSGAWRACDAAALRVVTAAGAPAPETTIDLLRHGDSEEKLMMLRCAQALPIDAATGYVMFEAQRTNQVNHVAAGTLDSNLLARAVTTGDPDSSGFGPAEFSRMILKIAFLDLPLERVFEAPTCATEEVSRMLQGLATEREAAGRKVWFGTNEMIGHAPAPGTLARLIGGLETGIDEHRLGAVRGVRALVTEAGHDAASLLPFLEERLPREDSELIRSELESACELLRARC